VESLLTWLQGISHFFLASLLGELLCRLGPAKSLDLRDCRRLATALLLFKHSNTLVPLEGQCKQTLYAYLDGWAPGVHLAMATDNGGTGQSDEGYGRIALRSSHGDHENDELRSIFVDVLHISTIELGLAALSAQSRPLQGD